MNKEQLLKENSEMRKEIANCINKIHSEITVPVSPEVFPEWVITKFGELIAEIANLKYKLTIINVHN